MKLKFSVVIPLLNEADCLAELWRRLQEPLQSLGVDIEVLFVDDASTDDTWARIQGLRAKDPRVKGVRLARHAGHQVAFFVGFQEATGEAVITLDGDLQHPPEKIPDFFPFWQGGADLVYGFKTEQAGRSWLKKALNRLFHKLLSLRTGLELHPETSDFQMLDRSLVERIRQTWRPPIFLRGWIHSLAQRRSGIPFRAERRFSGRTKQKLIRLCGIGLYSLLSFPSDSEWKSLRQVSPREASAGYSVLERLG